MSKKMRIDSGSESFYPFTRQNYYFSKLLTANDLQSEQRYLNEKRWLINRYGIGWGVLCGLQVIRNPENQCELVIEPGVAIDEYGNEIVVHEPQLKNLLTAFKKLDAPIDNEYYYITIKYHECPIEPSPIATEDCGDFNVKQFYNKTQETFKIEVSLTPPEPLPSQVEEFHELVRTEIRCGHFPDTPAPVVDDCVPREKWQTLTLACVQFVVDGSVLTGQVQGIDNLTYRKVAFSNDMLYTLIQGVIQELWYTKAAQEHDRRRHVPLLANTIKGLDYLDGRNAKILDAGIDPFRITSDGDFIWITDRENHALMRIEPGTNKKEVFNVVDASWGSAFDGSYLWLSHNQEVGKLTRIKVCDPADRKTFSDLIACPALVENAQEQPLDLAFPQEVVYHQDHLFLSHGWDQSSGGDSPESLVISVIDVRQCCLLERREINPSIGRGEERIIPVTPICSMASDGDGLWIVYTAESRYGSEPVDGSYQGTHYGDPYSVYTVVRRIHLLDKDEDLICRIRNIREPSKLIFEGTHLWLTHEEGASKIDIETGNELKTVEAAKQTSMTYCGGEHVWTSQVGQNEARLNRVNIYTRDKQGEIELTGHSRESGDGLVIDAINDIQFDGTYVFVTARYHAQDEALQKGVIYRILP